jgi:3-phosphoshikimate 1-carboxyvinyltransferase
MAAAAAPWIELRAPRGLAATVVPPGSKSLTNRALLYAALARGRSTLHGPLESDDTRVMRTALHALGIAVHGDGLADDRDAVWHVEGRGGLHGGTAEAPLQLDVATAGTAARFLTAALAAGQVHAHVDGSPRMRERPMAQLTAALRAWGADIRGDRLPLRVAPIADGLPGAQLQLPRPDSSQFVSALIIAAAAARAPVTIELPDGTPATPYVDMTLAIHRAFGGEAGWTAPGRALKVCPAPLRATAVAIEPDASAATYPLALAAIHGGVVRIEGLGRGSVQGDVGFAAVLTAFGAAVELQGAAIEVRGGLPLRGIDVDLAAMPDTALTAAVVALHAVGPTRIRGVEVLRHHESDRIAAAAAELRKFGAAVEEHADGLTIVPPAPRTAAHAGPPPRIATYDDHRMAMAFALAAPVIIEDPGCVAKTFPRYFELLAAWGMVVDRGSGERGGGRP